MEVIEAPRDVQRQPNFCEMLPKCSLNRKWKSLQYGNDRENQITAPFRMTLNVIFKVNQGHQRSLEIVPFDKTCNDSYLFSVVPCPLWYLAPFLYAKLCPLGVSLTVRPIEDQSPKKYEGQECSFPSQKDEKLNSVTTNRISTKFNDWIQTREHSLRVDQYFPIYAVIYAYPGISRRTAIIKYLDIPLSLNQL